MDWRDYEHYIHKQFRRIFPEADIKHDVKRHGHLSETERQIDIYITGALAGFDVDIAVDCKYFSSNIDVKAVDSFVSMLRDVRANKGVMITNEGYSDAAWNRAYNDTQDLELRIIEFDDLADYQAFGAIPFMGSYCAYIPAPEGWVVDAEPSVPVAAAALYPLGLNEDVAFRKEGFMYLNFSYKDKNISSLDTLTNLQDQNVREEYPNATIEYHDTVEREDFETTLRIAEIAENYQGLEYTLFVDLEEFTMFIVLLEPNHQRGNYLKKLEWIGRHLIPGKLVFDQSGNPVSMERLQKEV
jgi:hypothetical protein